jgi:uncharacterized membrane protein YphA (DoxX/SURF4 family)
VPLIGLAGRPAAVALFVFNIVAVISYPTYPTWDSGTTSIGAR